MSDLASMSNIAYKKGNLMRYVLWGAGALCICLLIAMFFDTMTSDISAAVPEGYKFSVTNHYAEGSKIRTTYYVYEDHIIVEDESHVDGAANRAVLIYDGVNTDSLVYDPDDKVEVCELGTCQEKPKVLAVIKKILSRKAGREYIGF